MRNLLFFSLACLALALPANTLAQSPKPLPIRGIHLSAPAKKDVPAALEFIRTALPQEGVNVLILEFDYHFNFQSRPEFADPSAIGKDEAAQLAAACREHGIELIPQINCLGHQSWSRRNDRLLTLHPEFDETPGKYPNNSNIYCRSYCPLHPDVHKVLFALMDELAKACQSKSFHVGMDEVFILADPDCPRCKNKTAAEVFAGEVNLLQDHLKQIGCKMWMWGDRFLDGKSTGIGKWEASENNTADAINHVAKDIVICDWHYDKAPPTAEYFAQKGFEVVSCPWRKTPVALAQLAKIQALRADGAPVLGMVQTTWCGFTPFLQAYKDQKAGKPPANKSAAESAQCFIDLFKAINSRPVTP